ncbi:MAG: TonB-dependent receptor [Bacteroidaceae bacterium]|nr:TonB-dependent receptor [Bacteroidaceae bacterium]
MASSAPSAAFASTGTAPMQQQQSKKIQGVVVDEFGEPVIGASVLVKATSTGAATDLDGRFAVDAAPGATLQISCIGYITQTVKATAGTMKIVLLENSQSLNDVVVVGYGVMKRSDLTGAVSSIDEKAIKQGVNTSIEQAMQGRIAGVQVTQNSGAPGGGISVQIRGINSLNGNEPLYVIDGVAMSGQTSDNSSVLSTLNPSDITSLEVLKDASATAIYGSRASNGVVLITTKRGTEGKPKVTYEGMMGWQSLPKHLDMMNLQQYAKYYNDRAELWGWGAQEQYKDPSLLTKGTDWQKELFQTAFMHQHQLGVSGGTKDMSYNLAGGYLSQEGIGVGSGFTRASFRANFDTNVNKWLKVGANGYFARTRQIITFDDADGNGGSVIRDAISMTPDVAARNADGSYDSGAENEFNYTENPLFKAQQIDNHNKKSQLDYNLYANITPIKDLVLRIEYGGSFSWTDTYFFRPEYTYGSNNQKVESQASRTSATSKYKTFKQYATYDFDPWKNQHLQVMFGHEAQWGDWSNLQAGRKGYISSAIHSLHVGDSSTATNDEQGSSWSIESYFGRLNYNLFDRYLLTATLRADGSSSFGPNNRWGWFPSAAAAWRVNNEKFMEGTKNWLSNLKVRVGWGLVGNQSTGSYAYGVAMGTSNTAWGTGYYASNYANPDLKWESTKAWNLGFDFAFLNNRIEFIVDMYYKNTDNLLMQASLPTYLVDVDGYRGITAPWVNAGSIRNKGIEFTLNTVNIDNGPWKWRTGATLSINRNKLTKLNSDDSSLQGKVGDGVYTLSEIGGPVGRFYGWKSIGMFTKEDDFYQKNQLGEFLLDVNGEKIPVARRADSDGNLYDIKQNGIWVGDYIFEDYNGDGKIDESDCQYIGDPNPKFTFGLNNSISYKNVEVSFFISGSVGNDVYNVLRQTKTDPAGWGNKMAYVASCAQIAYYDENGSLSDISNVYVANPQTAKCWRIEPSGGGQNDNDHISSLFVEDGTYVRLKSLSVAWNLPKRWIEKAGIEWCQLYANAQNLFTITGYKGYDPEIGSMGQSVILQGLDNGRYPSQRIFNIGIKLNF